MNDPAPRLRMEGISKRFGATAALKGVSLSAHAGRVLALLGENGAGKSTLMKVLSGAHHPDLGSITLAGEPYAPNGPHDARSAGVAMIYQELNLAGELSVEDNIMLGQEERRFCWLNRAAQRRRVQEALASLGHADLSPEAIVGQLSVGMQQLVEIARALVFDAGVIAFDEPTSSLPRHDVRRLFEVIERLKRQGRAIVYISHFLEEVREVADDYVVLRDGETVGEGCLDDVDDQQLVTLMVGRSVDELIPRVPHDVGETILKIEGLSGETSPREVSLDVRRGEILGVAGLVGAGRTELLRCLFGLDPVRRGSIRIGTVAHQPQPRRSILRGLGLLSEDRKGEGLAQALSIEDNLTLSRLGPYTTAGWLSLARRRAAVDQWIRLVEIKARDAGQCVEALSGGNQQKVAIARVLHQNADILLLDEPTRGIDVGTKAQIYRLIGRLAAEGKAILFVSSYLPELLAVCDRLAVMSRGRLREVRPVAQWTEETVLACAVGSETTT